MILIHNLAMTYGQRVLFDEVNLTLSESRRYGLVGANGTGKSTLLRLLAGEEEPASGTISYPKRMNIGWLKQDQFRFEHDLVLNVVLRGKPALWNALEEKDHILKNPITTDTGYRLADLEDIIAQENGYAAESIAQRLLSGLGITEAQQFDTMSALSGGFKLRVLLAQALFNNPDMLILDEPNNYLDIDTIVWLQNYLINTFKGLLVFTSHDQQFLTAVATHILDIDYGEVREYTGTYDYFVKQKALVIEQKLHERSYKEKKIARLKIFIERFRASASKSSQALAREKALEKMELPDIEQSSRRAPHFSFSIIRPSGKQVLKVHRLDKSFGEKTVLRNITFTIERGEKVAILGQNGIGKSTLLKILMGLMPPDKGSFEWGHETHVSYFAQEHHEMAHDQTSAYDWLSNHTVNIPSNQLRQTLGTHLFSQDDAYKKVSCLSGGEISRLIAARMHLEKGNVLLFDEPTNHLDLESREALAHAIKTFQGTVLTVSHDRHFVAAFASRALWLTPQDMIDQRVDVKQWLLSSFGK